MQRCRSNDVSAVRREIMWRRVRPILAHTNVISHTLPCGESFILLKSDARTHRTPKALRAKIRRSQSTSGGELARVSREFLPEEFHLPIRTTDAVAVLLDAAAASVKASPQL